MNASEAIGYDKTTGYYYSTVDGTSFGTSDATYNYNLEYLGLEPGPDTSYSIMTPVGIRPAADTYSLDSAGGNGISGPINDFSLPNTEPGASPNGWSFLSGLAQTTMQTAGSIIGGKLQQEVTTAQGNLYKSLGYVDPNTPKPVAKPAMSSGLVVGLGALVLGGIFLSSRRRS